MTAVPSVQQHPASVDAYIRHGWSLVPIPMGTKGPRTAGWNLRQAALRSQTDLPQGYGIGLAHAYSGTMALDVDHWQRADVELQKHGVSLQSLYEAPDAVIIDSSNPGHGKLLYSMPFGLALPSRKLIDTDAQGRNYNYLDFRCGTANGLTVQDVLPPSIHPDTHRPYQWAGRGNWTRLPTIPDALLDWWRELLDSDKQRNIGNVGSVDASWEEIRSALEFINPDVSREEWITIGMALHWAGSQTNQLSQALHLWNEWSSQSQTKYPGERAILVQWNSFRPDKASTIKLGSLFHIARRFGWVRPAVDVAGMFGDVKMQVVSPADVTADLRRPPPKMNLSLWPSVLSTRAQEVSDSVGCDPLVPLFAGLAAVCGVVDARIRLELVPGFKVPPVLWLMTLGDPADKKSPGSRPMLAPLKDIELEDRPRYQKELLDWEGKEAAYATAKKAFLEFAGSTEALLGAQAPMVPDLPPQPVALKITVSDITSQKLVRQAADRPRGLLCHLDEMNSWVRKMTDKTSGEDRSAWVVSYESERYEMDRVGAGSIHADNLAVSIYGNIQPQVFRSNLANLAADGLLQRFIPAILHDKNTRLGHPIPDYLTTAAAWENLLRLVYSLPVQTYKLSTDAYKAFREFQAWYESAKQDERLIMSSSTFMTAFGKLEGTAGRLILMFHLMENPFSPTVEVGVVNRVVHIVKTYIIPAYRYALGEFGGVDEFDQWMTDYVIQYCDTGNLRISDIKRSMRRFADGKSPWAVDQMIMNAMHNLEKAGWVIRVDDGTKEHQHYAEWAMNPTLVQRFVGYRKAVIDAKQRTQDYIYRLSPLDHEPVYGYEGD